MTALDKPPGLTLTVGMFARGSTVNLSGLELASAMVKTALLYADNVKLVGQDGALRSAIAFGMAEGNVGVAPGREREAEAIISAVRATDVYRAIRRGLVSTSMTWAKQDEARFFVQQILDAIDEPGNYPLLDLGTIQNLDVELGNDAPEDFQSALERGKHAFLARKLMERLPTFDEASLDEVLEVRRELDKYLVRFRSGLMKFSQDVDTNPYSTDFPRAMEDWFTREVEPAISDIEQAVRANRLRSELARNFATKAWVLPANSGLAMMVAQTTSVSKLLSQLLSLAGGAGLVGYDAFKQWEQKKREVEKLHLFLYYSMRQRMRHKA